MSFCENLAVDAVWAHEMRGLSFEKKKIADLLNAENVPDSFKNQARLEWIIQRKMYVEAVVGFDNID